ncbi:MAG TPA: DUF2752 domain-containing protein [Thermoanaerobaculia bacterium]|nr:DUF2752 domain-containing protein [Thermoanaerobaculia bacterium]
MGPVGLPGLAAFVVLAVWQPTGGAESSIGLFRRATGIPCPGCGLTRASPPSPRFRQDFAFHPFVYPIALDRRLTRP